MDKKIIDILWKLLYNIQVSICRKIFQTDAEGKGGGY